MLSGVIGDGSQVLWKCGAGHGKIAMIAFRFIFHRLPLTHGERVEGHVQICCCCLFLFSIP